MKRRDFLKTSAATATGASALPLNATATQTEPLKAELKVRVMHLRLSSDDGVTIISDGSPHPRKLVRPEVIDARFGKGTSQTLLQADHWRMIDAGWFGEEELYEPADIDDPAFRIWHANYKPEVEAHDLLRDLLGDRISGPFGGAVPELGLVFAEHPCTPRLATVKLSALFMVPDLAEAVSAKTKWIVIDPEAVSSSDFDPAPKLFIH